MRKLSTRVKNELESQSRMKQCSLRNVECHGRIEWHHCWIYAGRQIDEPWAIVSLCKYHHKEVDKNPDIKLEAQKISLKLATEEDLDKYPGLETLASVEKKLQEYE